MNLTFKQRSFFEVFLFNLVVIIPSVRIFYKVDFEYVFPVYFVIANFIFYFRQRLLQSKFLKYNWWIFFVILVFAFSYFVYPIVSLRNNPGSTGDDAIIVSVESLWSSGKIYDRIINANAPISPGPGWILLNSPFILFNLYWFFAPFYFLLLVFLMKLCNGKTRTNAFVFFLFQSFVFWELLANGHDLLPFSMALFPFSFFLFNKKKLKDEKVKTLLISLLFGVVATARIVFAFLPFLYYFLLRRENNRKALLFFTVSFGSFLLLNSYYYFINENYQPLHLISKGIRLLGSEFFIFLMLVGTIGFFILVTKKIDYTINPKAVVLFTLSLFLLPLAYWDLIRIDFDFKYWEGANYLIMLTPFVVDFVIKSNISERITSS